MKPKTTLRPWGSFRQFVHNEAVTVKTITVKPGEAFSLQYHYHRQEFWYVLSGTPRVTVGKRTVTAKPGSEFLIRQKVEHRIEAGRTPVVILEIAFGSFDETDIVRLEDKYGRA